ncbi:hypothetical protein A2U01_0110109, partial [Trifolium medium]|nr:hypothetical protein [Trifolium medium]
MRNCLSSVLPATGRSMP